MISAALVGDGSSAFGYSVGFSVDFGESGRGICLGDWISFPVAKSGVSNFISAGLLLNGLSFRCFGVSLGWLGPSEKPILIVW